MKLRSKTRKELEKVARQKATFPFMELSRELRDMVYNYAWGDVTFGITYHKLVFIVRHGAFPELGRMGGRLGGNLGRLPTLVNIDPVITGEAMEHLYRCAQFSLGETMGLPYENKGEFEVEAKSNLERPIQEVGLASFSLKLVKNLRLCCWWGDSHDSTQGYSTIRPYPRPLSTYDGRGIPPQRTFSSIREPIAMIPQLKTLELNLQLGYYSTCKGKCTHADMVP
jgi:hypothetical protein